MQGPLTLDVEGNRVLLGLLIFRTGWFFLQQFVTPPPPHPDPGTLGNVELVYPCPNCGTPVAPAE